MKRISVALFTGAFILSSAILPSAALAEENLAPLTENTLEQGVLEQASVSNEQTKELTEEKITEENVAEEKTPAQESSQNDAVKEETSTPNKDEEEVKTPASAEETPTENNTSQKEEEPNSEQEEEEGQLNAGLDVEVGLFPIDDEQVALYVYSAIQGVKEAKGTWTIQVNGEEVKSYTNKGVEIKDFIIVNNQSKFTVHISFNGVGENGKELKLHETVDVDFPDFNIDVKNNNGKTTVTGTVGSASDVLGDWEIYVYDEEDNVVAEANAKNHKGTSFTKTFDLKPGFYFVEVYFEGEVDGTYFELIDFVELEVKGGTKPPVEQPQKPGGDNGKTPEPPVQPAQPDQLDLPKSPADSAKQPNGTGGVLPKTATTYPTYLLMGALLLLVGSITLFKSRRSTK